MEPMHQLVGMFQEMVESFASAEVARHQEETARHTTWNNTFRFQTLLRYGFGSLVMLLVGLVLGALIYFQQWAMVDKVMLAGLSFAGGVGLGRSLSRTPS